MTRKSLLSFFIAIAVINLSIAQKPDWISLDYFFINAAFDLSAPELSKQIYLYQRCAAQHLALSNLIKQVNTDRGRQLLESASVLTQAANLVRIDLAQERTQSSPDTESISRTIPEVVMHLYEQYMGWFNRNYLNNGSYFANDEELQDEMLLCGATSKIAGALPHRVESNQ